MAAITIALSAALPAWSASVVDVRVGRHPEFTRVVFELDEPAGYRLQRRVPSPGVSELVVSLEAVAKAQKIRAGKGMIEGVAIAPEGSKKSVARIRLSREGLRVKEMILASPPRIVLDVLGPPKPKAASVSSPKPKAAASKQAASKTTKKSSAPVAETKKTSSAAKPVAKAASKKAAPAPVPKPVATTPKPVAKATEPAVVAKETKKPASEATALTGGLAAQTPGKETKAPSGVSPVAAVDPAKSASPASRPASQKLAMVAPAAPKPTPPAASPRPPAAKVAKPTTTIPPPPRAKKAAPKPTPARSTPPPGADGSAFDMKTVGGGVVAALAFVGLVGFLLMRRRTKHEVLDDGDFEGDPLAADNPFAELGDDLAMGGATQPKLTDSAVDTEAETSGLQEDLFGAASAEAETGAVPQEPGAAGESMDTMSEMPTTPNLDGSAMMAGAGAAAGDDVMSMLRAFEQRISSLESKLAEVSEAKERLERQVAAQTEELRVQRAAIARTQRAVRNLNRPEDEAPTEPALRDPSRPGGPRTDG